MSEATCEKSKRKKICIKYTEYFAENFWQNLPIFFFSIYPPVNLPYNVITFVKIIYSFVTYPIFAHCTGIFLDMSQAGSDNEVMIGDLA